MNGYNNHLISESELSAPKNIIVELRNSRNERLDLMSTRLERKISRNGTIASFRNAMMNGERSVKKIGTYSRTVWPCSLFCESQAMRSCRIPNEIERASRINLSVLAEKIVASVVLNPTL